MLNSLSAISVLSSELKESLSYDLRQYYPGAKFGTIDVDKWVQSSFDFLLYQVRAIMVLKDINPDKILSQCGILDKNLTYYCLDTLLFDAVNKREIHLALLFTTLARTFQRVEWQAYAGEGIPPMSSEALEETIGYALSALG